MRRCRYCGRSDGELVFQPAEADYVPGRRNYRARGIGPSYHHAECRAEVEAELAAAKARDDAEFAETIAELRRQIASGELT